jgi:uncharacterized protein (DUF488 family)
LPRRTVFTIGYEKTTPAAFMAELKRAGVKLVVDTRAVAASRRPGFSKRQLAAGLDEHGIGYVHLQKLGTPAEGRQAARAGDAETLWRVYEQHLQKPEAIEAMDELLSLVQSRDGLCLLCFERDPGHCHRTRIGEIVRERAGATIENLFVPPA